MAQQSNIRVNLQFKADTSAAKTSLQSLQQSINGLLTSASTGQLGNVLAGDLQRGQEAALQLQNALRQAVNVDTNKLDLAKFEQSLRASGTNLNSLYQSFSKLGSQGQATFKNLTQAIINAEVPMRRSSELVKKMGQTLASTARWQISSSALRIFTSSIRDAYQYAQDLNKSLNDIRIVTGYSADKMEDFAKTANRAAKALSATTTEYTKAALIYYQQGLDDQAVKARTDVTIKLANVTGESAEQVSSYMTGIWNNFAQGSEQLEIYADKITALGAATASSSEEIAEGLQKFSAVANTVGLSYDYATAALATVVSQTRQSADIVGTAFKTIFARLESLSLGESLDDDTTLTKYSQALATVGVSIKDSNGALKDMDQIVDELGQKWQIIDRDQQVALAQTVAGMRQYNNFIALMDNYDEFKVNVDIAADAEGSLQEQADIYAESWEAASDRVKASAQDIYAKLLDDDMFIGMFDGFSKLLDFLSKFIDSAGGLEGIFTMLGAILFKVFNTQIATGLDNMVYNMKSFIGLTEKSALKTKEMALRAQEAAMAQQEYVTAAERREHANNERIVAADRDKINASRGLDEYGKAQVQDAYSLYEATIKADTEAGYRVQAATEAKEAAMMPLAHEARIVGADAASIERNIAGANNLGSIITTNTETAAASLGAGNYDAAIAQAEQGLKPIEQALKSLDAATDPEMIAELNQAAESLKKIKNEAQALKEDAAKGDNSALSDEERKRMGAMVASEEANKAQGTNKRLAVARTADALQTDRNKANQKFGKDIDNVIEKQKELNEAQEEAEKSQKSLTHAQELYTSRLKQAQKPTLSWSSTLTTATQSAMSLGMALNAFESVWDTLSNPDMSGWDKFKSVLMSAGMAIPMLMSGVKGLNTVLTQNALVQSIVAAKTMATTGAELAAVGVEQVQAVLRKKELSDEEKILALQALGMTALAAETTLKASKSGVDVASLAISEQETKAKRKETIARALTTMGIAGETAAKIASTMASVPLLVITLALVAAFAVLVGVIILIVKAFKNMAANSPEGQLKAAREEASALNTALQETKEAAQALKETFDKYEDVQKRLHECQVGTEEWNEALQENNDLVLEMMKNYPELAGLTNEAGEAAIAINSRTGEMEIADWAQDKMLDLTNQSVVNATLASISANAKVRDKEINVLENKNSWNAAENELKKVQEELAAIRRADAMASKAEQATLIANATKLAHLEGIEQYTQQINAAISEKTGEVSEEVEALIRKYEEEGLGTKGISKATGVNDEVERVAALWIEATGRNDLSIADTTGSDDNRQFIFVDSEGKEVKRTLDQLRREIASGEVNKQIIQDAEDIGQLYKDKNYGKGQIDFLTAATTGNTDFMARRDIQNILATDAGVRDLIQELNLTDKDLQTLGIESEAKLINKLRRTIYESKQAWAEELAKQTTIGAQEIRSVVSNAAIDLTDEELLSFGQTVSDVYASMGADAADAFGGTIENLLAANQDHATEIMALLTNLDWTNPSQAFAEFSLGLSDLGIYLNTSTAEFKQFNEALQSDTVSLLNYNLEALRENLSSINDILSDISFGDVISDEDYRKLLQYNSGIAELFMMTADGFQFIGDEKDLNDKVRKNSKEQLAKSLENNQRMEAARASLSTLADSTNKDDITRYFNKMSSGQVTDSELANAAAKLQGETALLSALDIDKEYLAEITEKARNNDEAAKEELQNIFGEIQTLMVRDEAGQFDDEASYSVYAMSLSLEELKEAEEEFEEAGVKAQLAWQKAINFKTQELEEYKESVIGYRDAEAAMASYAAQLELTAKLRERAAPGRQIKLLEKEAQLYKDQAKTLKGIVADKERKLQLDQQELVQKLADTGLDISLKFDDSGRLLNMGEVLAIIAGSNESKEAWEEELEAYNEDVDAITEDRIQVIEFEYAALDSAYEAIDIGVNFEIDARAFRAEMDELMEGWYEDIPFRIAENITAIEEAHQRILDDVEARTEGLIDKAEKATGKAFAERGENESEEEYNKRFSEFITEAIAIDGTLQDGFDQWKDDQLTSYESYLETTKAYADELVNFFNDITEAYDNVADRLDAINSTTDHYLNVIDILGKKTLGVNNDMMRGLKTMQTTGAQTNLTNAKNEYDELTARRAQVKKDLTGALNEDNEEAAAVFETRLKEIDQMISDSAQNVQATFEDALTAVVEEYQYNIELAVEEFEKSIAGAADSLEALSEAFEQQSTLNEQYLADYKKMYELSKLRRQIEQSIDATSNVKSQRALRDLTNEITLLEKNSAKVSEYQLEMLQKRYELKLAEQTLEEGKSSSRTMTLRRNEAGGWSYEYTSGEDMSDTMQAYEDALFALTETNQTHIQTLQSELIGVQQEFSEGLMNIANDMSLSIEEKQAKMDELMSYYNERLAYYEEQLGLTFDDANWLYNYDLAGYTSNIISKEGLTRSWKQTTLAVIGETETAGLRGAFENFRVAATTALGSENGGARWALTQFNEKMNTTFSANDTTITTWIEKISSDLTNTETGLEAKLNAAISEIDTSEWENKLDEFTAKLDPWIRELQAKISALAMSMELALDMDSSLKAVGDLEGQHSEALSTIENTSFTNSTMQDIWKQEGVELARLRSNYITALLSGDEGAITEAETAYTSKIQSMAGSTRDTLMTGQSNVAQLDGVEDYELDPSVYDELHPQLNSYASTQTNYSGADTVERVAELNSGFSSLGLAGGEKATEVLDEATVEELDWDDEADKYQKILDDNLTGYANSENYLKNYQHTEVQARTTVNEEYAKWLAIKDSTQELINAVRSRSYSKEERQEMIGAIDNLLLGTTTWTEVLATLNDAEAQVAAGQIQIGDGVTIKPELGQGNQRQPYYIPEPRSASGAMRKGGDGFASDMYNNVVEDSHWDPINKKWYYKLQYRTYDNERWFSQDQLEKKPLGSSAEGRILYADYNRNTHPYVYVKYPLSSGGYNYRQNVKYSGNSFSSTLTNTLFNNLYSSSKGPYGVKLGAPIQVSDAIIMGQTYPQSRTIYPIIYPHTLNFPYSNKDYQLGVSSDQLNSYWPGRSFDTGGYTGAWGPEGRLAMLHQKEIVLNAMDTKNLLSAVDIIRQIAQVIDLQATAAQHGLGNLSFTAPNNNNQMLQQEVTIHAEFPNATDHNEIEEAFNQLINHTSQFIHRN